MTIEVINRAGLNTTLTTTPIVVDTSKPTGGHVTEGSVFEEDIVWWGHLDHVTGELILQEMIIIIHCSVVNFVNVTTTLF